MNGGYWLGNENYKHMRIIKSIYHTSQTAQCINFYTINIKQKHIGAFMSFF